MAPTDRIHLPFRWQFVPAKDGRDGSVRLEITESWLLEDDEVTIDQGAHSRIPRRSS